MGHGDAVKNLEFTVRYAIREWDYDGETRYDWIRDDGTNSFDLFKTIEDAEYDIKSRY